MMVRAHSYGQCMYPAPAFLGIMLPALVTLLALASEASVSSSKDICQLPACLA